MALLRLHTEMMKSDKQSNKLVAHYLTTVAKYRLSCTSSEQFVVNKYILTRTDILQRHFEDEGQVAYSDFT